MRHQTLRVALLTDAFARRGGEVVDGVAHTLRRLADHCAAGRHGGDIRLTVLTHGQEEDSVTVEGPLEILRFKPLLPLAIHPRWRIDAIPCRPRVVGAICARRPQLIHVASPGSMGLAGLAAARRLGVPLLGSYHTAYEENIRRRVEKGLRSVGLPHRRLGRLFDRLTWAYVTWFFNHMRRVVAPSRHTCAEIARRFSPEIGLFSRGVDCEVFSPRFRREPPRLTALFVGRLVVDKNLEALVEIFADRRDVRLVVVGDGPERPWLETALPLAEFTGHLSGEALSVAYASADLFVFPSETETFGNVVLEAMASGLPVVTSDRMAPKELIEDGVTGYVGRVGVDFHHRVDELIRDAATRRRMGEAARRFAATRSWSAVFAGLLAEYRTAVDRAVAPSTARVGPAATPATPRAIARRPTPSTDIAEGMLGGDRTVA